MSEARSGGKTDTLVKLLMVLFISLFSFSVGTFFGKKTTESSLKRAALESQAHSEGDRETASIPPGSTEVKPEDALSEEELAKLSDEHDEAEKVPKNSHDKKDMKKAAAADHHETSGHKDVTKNKTETTHAKAVPEKFKQVQKAAEKVAHGESPTPNVVHAEKRKPASLPAQVASATIGKFTVQVSSHQSEGEAEKHAANLKTKGFNAFYVKATIGGKPWYRVSVGLFTSRKEATEYVATLKKDGQVAAAIVQKIVE